MASLSLRHIYKKYPGGVTAVSDFNLEVKDKEFIVRNEDQFRKCGWTPYEGATLKGSVETVFVGGNIIYKEGKFI